MHDLIDLLKKNEIIKYGDFTFVSGKKSKNYVDIKEATTKPLLLKTITEKASETIKRRNIKADYVGGVALGGVPLATALSLETDLPLILVRKEDKGYGTGGRLVGSFEKGKKVVLIEDATTKATSSIPAVKALRDAGLMVEYLIVVVDREEGATENLKKEGIELIPLAKLSDLLEN